ncbi:MAG: DUF4290 domain-containing protein [Flavobacteriales bacterium]|jgi:hypothetical protein|tara:strand:- start:278 stop:895 length:618 start_codon:yes stop_codon:yes gene_type:complete
MEYNTSLPHLIIPEYGRNVQKMVHSIVEIEDREKRNHQAKAIIEVMGNLNPHLRDVPDFKHKLWDHLFIMSDFLLDVDSPYGKPSKESFEEKPLKVPYSDNKIKLRYYGKILPQIIDRAVEMEDSDHKDIMVFCIANHMKKSYLTWNKSSVEDEMILKHLSQLSDSKLEMKDTFTLSAFADVKPPEKTQKKQQNNRGRSQHGKRK